MVPTDRSPRMASTAADAVDERGRQRRHERHRGEEDAGEQRDPDAEVAHDRGLLGVGDVLGLAAPEELEEHRAADVEPLGHGVAEVGVAVHLLPGEAGEAVAHHARGEQQDREECDAQQRDRPAEEHHRHAHDDRGDDVGDGALQRGGERPLRADDVVVEAADEGAGLGAGEEGQRLPLHVGEDAGAEVVDESLTDAARQPARDEAEAGVDDGHHRHQDGEPDDQRCVTRAHGVVDDRLEQQGRHHDERRVDDRDRQERLDQPSVRARETEHPAQRAPLDLVVDDAPVTAQVSPRRATCARSHRHACSS